MKTPFSNPLRQLLTIISLSFYEDLFLVKFYMVQRYLHPVLLKEVLYTRWGNYEMPEPYKILLEKGPRKNWM